MLILIIFSCFVVPRPPDPLWRQGFYGTALNMGQAAMAFPAISVSHINPGNGFLMATLTIFLGYFGSSGRQADIFRDTAGIKYIGIPHPLKALLEHMVGHLIVW